MKKAKFLEWGNPLMYQKSKPVAISQVSSEPIRKLIRNMFSAIKGVGVGLAAIQLGMPLRVIVISLEPNKSREEIKAKVTIAAINPTIIWRSKETEEGWEGNLCFPGVMGRVRRAKKIKVTYWNERGEKITELLDGFSARVFQHEYEQLDGKNFISNMADPTKLITRSEYNKRLLSN